ncbi:MAG: hypothetical protein AB8G96_01060 [Phycisphaerales bacterium]
MTVHAASSVAIRSCRPLGHFGQLGSLGHLRRIAILLLALFAAAPVAQAQSSRDLFAPPMTGRDVDALALRLELTPSQRVALDPPHERYLAQYATLQEKELEPFITRNLRSWRRFIFNPDPKMAKDILREFDRFSNRIAIMDEQFLSEIDAVLSDDQRARMPRIRSRRALDRANSGLLLALREAGGAGIDVARLTEAVAMSDEDRAILAPRLQPYELQLAQTRDRLKNRAETTILELVEIASEMLRDALAGNVPADGTVWESMEGVFLEKIEPVARSVRDLSSFNRRSLNEWRGIVSEPTADRLAIAFWSRGYREASRPVESALGQYDRALRLPGVSESERQQISAWRASVRLDLMQQADQLIGRIDEAQTDPEQITARGETTRMAERSDAERERLEAASATAVEQLHALLGPERTERLDARPENGGPAEAETTGTVAVARRLPSLLRTQPEVASLQITDPTFAPAADFVPGMIEPEELAWYATILNLGEDQRAVAEALHMDYADEFSTFVTDEVEPYIALRSEGTFQPNDDAAAEAERVAALQQIPVRRAELTTEVEAMDAIFLGMLSDLVVNPNDPAQVDAMARVQQARQRVRLSRGSSAELAGGAGEFMGRMDPAGGSEELIDLSRMVFEMQEPSIASVTDPILRSYEAGLTESLRRRHAAWVDMDSLMAQMAVSSAEGGEFWSGIQPARSAIRAARSALVDLNRATLEQIAATIGTPLGEEMQSRYKRMAYARAYRDRNGAEPSLMAAMELDSMDDGRRIQIGRLLAEYRPEYRRLSDAIVELRRAEADERGDWQDRWQRSIQRRVRQEQLEFERDEFSSRTLRRLRVALSDEEAFAVGFRVDQR